MSNKLYKCSKCGKKKQGFELSVRSGGKLSSRCKLCSTKAARESVLRRKDAVAAYRKEYRKENRESITAYQEEYRTENRVEIRRKQEEHRKANQANYTAKEGLRRASKLQRTPKWLTATDISKIKSIYKMARALSKKTGNPHHVDHIIPLQGELVSGLHCPANLQVIPASENLSKSNKYSV